MEKYQKKIISIFIILIVSTLLFTTTPLGLYMGYGGYGAITGAGVGSIAGFPGIMIGGTLGYFVAESEEVSAWLNIALAVVGGVYGGFKASGGTCSAFVPENIGTCEVCNNDLIECTEYYCASLGQNCEYLEKERECITTREEDRSAPSIIECLAKNTDSKADYNVESSINGCEIKEEIPTFSRLGFGFLLDEPAQCKIFPEPGHKFSDSGAYLDEQAFGDKHFLFFEFGNLTLQTIEKCREGELCNAYIRCQDKLSNPMGSDYFIKFKLQEAPDISKPRITSTLVESGAAVPSNVNEADFFMYVDDRTGVLECRYNKGEDINFEEMSTENKLICETQKDPTQSGFRCSTKLKNITPGQENKYYFRCRDSSPRQNTMDQGFEFIIRGTEPLTITGNNLPQGTIFRPSQSLFVSTSAKARCEYKLDGNEEQEFSATDDTTSTLDINFEIGSHTMDVTCTDDAGNQATISAVFNVDTPELRITEVKPKDTTVYTNIVPVTVKTTGGAYNNGNSTCRYGSGIQFNKNILTSETVHDANISLSDGVHTITINCDDGFKQDEETTRLEVNSVAYPSLRRVYTSGGALIITTDQPSTCAYSNRVKDFEFTTGLKMSTSNNVQHQLQLNGEGIYYVKCEDTRTKRLSPGYTIIP